MVTLHHIENSPWRSRTNHAARHDIGRSSSLPPCHQGSTSRAQGRALRTSHSASQNTRKPRLGCLFRSAKKRTNMGDIVRPEIVLCWKSGTTQVNRMGGKSSAAIFAPEASAAGLHQEACEMGDESLTSDNQRRVSQDAIAARWRSVESVVLFRGPVRTRFASRLRRAQGRSCNIIVSFQMMPLRSAAIHATSAGNNHEDYHSARRIALACWCCWFGTGPFGTRKGTGDTVTWFFGVSAEAFRPVNAAHRPGIVRHPHSHPALWPNTPRHVLGRSMT